ncbi:MAG: helix-turn-helix domain-containing protein, partial [Bacteroidota bacterium]
LTNMIVFLSSTIIVLSIIMFLYNRELKNYNGLLAAYLIIFALYAISHNQTLYSKNVFLIAIFWNNFSPLYLLSGPILYFYVKATLDDTLTWKWHHLIHLIPTVLLFIGIIPYISSPFETKLDAARLIANDLNNIKQIRMNTIFPNLIVYFSRPLLILSYIIAAGFILIKKIRNEKEPSRQFLLVTKWLGILLIISSILMLILAIMGSNLFTKDTNSMLIELRQLHVIAGAFMMILPLTLLLFPQIFYGIPVRENDIEQKINVEIAQIQTEKFIDASKKNQASFKILSENILAYFENEKPYLDASFNLTSLASSLNVPQHHISYCFSDFIDTSFTKLRASKRIEYAKSLLLQGITKDFTIDKVAEMSGFSSRSTFFSTFKEYTGLTPTEFVEKTK